MASFGLTEFDLQNSCLRFGSVRGARAPTKAPKVWGVRVFFPKGCWGGVTPTFAAFGVPRAPQSKATPFKLIKLRGAKSLETLFFVVGSWGGYP